MTDHPAKKSNRRVVITGLGVISSLGIGWEEFWKNLVAGKSGISPITAFDTASHDRYYGAEVKNFDPGLFIRHRRVRCLGRTSQMAIAASKLALRDAAFLFTPESRRRTAVCVGTTTGEIQLLEQYNDYRFNRRAGFDFHLLPVYPASSLSVNIAVEFKLNNTNAVFATACASGNYALAWAYDQIKSSRADYALAGGADAISRIVFTGFGRLYAVAPEKCQPFDKNRKGMIPGEGAGMLFLETLEGALSRKAPIYAEVAGYGLSCSAKHMTEPSVEGIAKAMEKALKDSCLEADDVDYISAHGTGTALNDKTECAAVNRVFGNRAQEVPVSSIKSMIGHTMGAASALETVVCGLAVKYGIIPPTINFEEKDPECDIYCVPNESIKRNVRAALNNSHAFGGNNACIVLGKII